LDNRLVISAPSQSVSEEENKMLIKSVTSKLSRAGWTVETYRDGSAFQARKTGNHYIIEFLRNGGTENAICLAIRKETDHDDMHSDYHAGCFADSIKEAITLAERFELMDRRLIVVPLQATRNEVD
jgi:hypothetical protein